MAKDDKHLNVLVMGNLTESTTNLISGIGAITPNATASTRRTQRLSLGTIYPLTAARPIIRAIGVIRIGKCHSAMT